MQNLKLAAAMLMLPIATIGFGSSAAFAASGNSGAERVRVIVAYKDGQRGNAARALALSGAEVHYDFAQQRGYAVSLPAVAVAGLARNPAIEYVEEDARRYPMAVDADGGDEQPYGIAMVQADQVDDTNAGNTTVCIIDSGVDGLHEDHNLAMMAGEYDAGTGWWYTDENHHGTHVAGTVAAINNGKGVVGVAPNSRLNLYIVKVFGADGWAYSSTLITALNKCVAGKQQGTNLVVSMSLGGSVKSRFEDTAFKNAYTRDNVLPIAAAGNGGNKRVSYPAGYASVVSVAAIDAAKAKASFSQYNSDVELAAPGVAVLSTVPTGTGMAAAVTVGTLTPGAEGLEGSPLASGNGPLVDCGLGGTVCAGATGKVCLIERGTYNFSDKVLNCQNGGGVGAVIYNNTTGPLLGTLGGVVTAIPSVGITQADGGTLKSGYLGQSATVTVAASNYARFDGTSMATPHVSGVAALVWSYAPRCTNSQVRSALTATAEDLGATGRDVNFGFGLVQASSAKVALSALACAQ